LPVVKEGFDAGISEGMIVELFEDFKRNGGYIGSKQGGFFDMVRMTDGGGQNLGFEAVGLENSDNFRKNFD